MSVHKPILNACCGGKMFYFDKNDPRVLFQDIREVKTTLCDGRKFEVKPDVQADFTSMPYPDNHFRMVVFDPPHLLRNVGKSKMADMYGSLNEKAQPTGYQHIKYGALYSDWRDMLRRGFAECFRVLMPGGFLIFKWNETDITVKQHYLMNPQFTSPGGSVDSPCFTLIAKMDKRPPYLIATETGDIMIEILDTDSPIAMKIKEFMVMYGIIDIKMRMLKIPELKKIMGFPEDYVLIGTQADQKKFIGNAVEVTIARAWCEALCCELEKHLKKEIV